MSRSLVRNAALLAASTALAVGLLSGCGAGQVSQTEEVRGPISGIEIASPDGKIQLRDLAIAYHGPEGYAQGSNAPVKVRIFTAAGTAVRLVGVTSDAGQVMVTGSGAAPASPPAATASPSPASPSPTNNRTASPGVAPAPPSPLPPVTSPTAGSPPAGSTQINIAIPADGFVVLAPDADRHLQVTGLTRPIRSTDSVEMTFRFDNGVTITAQVPVEIPMSPLPRSPIEVEEGH